MNENIVDEIEVTVDQLEEAISRGEAFERLRSNPDWKVLIEDEYLSENATRLVKLRGAGNVHPDFQENVLKEIDAIGYFADWLRTVHAKYQEAKSGMSELNEELDNNDSDES
jgi:hypothetical protein